MLQHILTMKTHLYLSALVLFFSFSVARAQNKKEQIVLLNQTIDSLKNTLTICESGSAELKQKNAIANHQVDSLSKLAQGLKTNVSTIQNELKNSQHEKTVLSNQNRKSVQQIDSLKQIIFMKEYVKIGEQIWMNENLNVTKFRNGDLIHEAKTPADWVVFCRSKQPCYTKLPNNQYLYNGFVISDSRGIGPVGCNLPSTKDFIKLFTTISPGKNGFSKVESLLLDYDWYIETYDAENGGGIKDSTGIGLNPLGFNIKKAGFIRPNGHIAGFELPSSLRMSDKYEDGFNKNEDYKEAEIFATCTYFWTSTKTFSTENSMQRYASDEFWSNQELNNVIDFGWCSQDEGGSLHGDQIQFGEYEPYYGFSIRLIKAD